jgi:hypothetical protein
MMWPELQSVAQAAVGRILNTLPEGLLVALCAWAMLRLLPRQNSGTRFAVWFVALLTVAGLPFVAGSAGHGLSLEASRPVIGLPLRWGFFLFVAWLVAASVAMLRVAAGLLRLRKLRTTCIAINLSALDPSVAATVQGFSSARAVALATSEEITVPAAIGFFRPMIVIPAWALRELPPEELNIILLHEFAHLRRWDDWSNLLQKIVRAVFLFHPAVWWIEKRVSLEREMACDDLVLAETANPRGYAKCLIGLLEKSMARRAVAMAQAAVHRAQEASLRLAQILDARRPQARHVWKPALGCVGAFSVICLAIAPHTPKFVAFVAPQSARTYAAQSYAPAAVPLRDRFPGAVVIPAALHTSSNPLPKATSKADSRATLRNARHRAAVPRALPSLKAREESAPFRAITASANEDAIPLSETFLLIRTTERTGPGSWRWSVYVYRLVWTNPQEEDGSPKAPVTHKT